jgi:peroxiredoxin Q/BCP
MTLNTGDKAPAFKGMTKDGALTLSDLKGAPFVLYFYPKDDTPGCTKEACAFRDNLPRFTKLGAKIYGVSKDDLKSHAKFAEKYELPFTLISDADGSICDSYETWVEKSMYGKKYMGIERTTYLIDKDGIIRNIWRKVRVENHENEVLEAIKSL